MLIQFEDRPSDSPVIERVWRSRSAQAGLFHSMATPNWVMVVTRLAGRTFLTIRGPETRASLAECPGDGEWIGIHFRLGTFMPLMSNSDLRDRNDATLPDLSGRRFLLDGSAWEYPGFDNAEVFTSHLLHKGLVAMDRHVQDVLQGQAPEVSLRTRQRRFLAATGIARGVALQVDRARRAVWMLRAGTPVPDVIHTLGYYDQAHLTHAMSRFIGRTPGQVARAEGQLSLLYKPDPL